MTAKLIGAVLGLVCLLGSVAPSSAHCPYHDQQASAAQQKTADATNGTTSAQ